MPRLQEESARSPIMRPPTGQTDERFRFGKPRSLIVLILVCGSTFETTLVVESTTRGTPGREHRRQPQEKAPTAASRAKTSDQVPSEDSATTSTARMPGTPTRARPAPSPRWHKASLTMGKSTLRKIPIGGLAPWSRPTHARSEANDHPGGCFGAEKPCNGGLGRVIWLCPGFARLGVS